MYNMVKEYNNMPRDIKVYDEDTIRLEKFLQRLTTATSIADTGISLSVNKKLINTLKGAKIRFFNLYDEVEEIYPDDFYTVQFNVPGGKIRDNKHVALVIIDLEDTFIVFGCSTRYDELNKTTHNKFVFRGIVKDNIEHYLEGQLSSSIAASMGLNS